MTEKQYGGSTGRENKSTKIIQNPAHSQKTKTSKIEKENSKSNQTDKEKILLAGKIASEVKEYAKIIIKKQMSLLEIAEKIEKAGGKIAMPKHALTGIAWQGYFLDIEGNVFGVHQPDVNAK